MMKIKLLMIMSFLLLPTLVAGPAAVSANENSLPSFEDTTPIVEESSQKSFSSPNMNPAEETDADMSEASPISSEASDESSLEEEIDCPPSEGSVEDENEDDVYGSEIIL